MRSDWEIITPSRAIADLDSAECGRDISHVLVAKYSRDMEAGRWNQDSPEGPIYDVRGVLRDGQNRYTALVEAALRLCEAGKVGDPEEFTLRMWVTRDMPASAFDSLNQGKPRDVNDILKTMSMGNEFLLGTVLRRVNLWETGHATGNSYKPTISERLALVKLDDDATTADKLKAEYIISAAAFAATWKVKPPVPQAGMAGFLWWLLGQYSEEHRDVFLKVLQDGGGGEDLSPVLLLRRRLHGDYYDSRQKHVTIRQEAVLWLCIRAWNAWRKGQKLSKLQLPEKLTDGAFIRPV